MEPIALISEYQIKPYRGSAEKLRQLAVMFTGSPRTSSQPGHILLLQDPASQHAFGYEFRTEDVLYADEAPKLALSDGSTVPMVRLWIKKGATGMKLEPFHVQDTAQGMREFFGD